MVAGLVLLQVFRPAPGQIVKRSDWLDTTVAVAVTAALGCGAMAVIAGIAGLLFPQP